MSSLTWFQRAYLGAVAALALWVGLWCYFVPGQSEAAIPWNVPPLCAGFLGAMYLSGAVFCGSSMLARRWVDVRVIMPMIAMWTGGLALISLFYLPLFDFSRPQVWVWFGAYVLYPLIALGLMWTQRGQRHAHAAADPALPGWARRYLRAQGGLMIALGLALLAAPAPMLRVWPWPTAALMLQLYSAPLLSYGLGSLSLARQRTWNEIRLALVAMAVFAGAELASVLYRSAHMTGPTLSVALWEGWLAVTTAALAALAWRAWRASQPAPAQRRTPSANAFGKLKEA